MDDHELAAALNNIEPGYAEYVAMLERNVRLLEAFVRAYDEDADVIYSMGGLESAKARADLDWIPQ